MINIYVNTPSWLLGTSTDFKLKKKLGENLKLYNDLFFYYPHNKFLSLNPNVKIVTNYLRNKFKKILHIPKEYSGWCVKQQKPYNNLEFLLKKDIDIIYSQGILPTTKKNIPVLLDIDYILPDDVVDSPSKSVRENFQKMTDIIIELSNRPGIYNVRNDKSIRLIKSVVSEENLWKFRNLFFLLPELKPLDVAAIEKKHRNKTTVKILFCGAEANRKGLPILIDAFLKFADHKKGKYELHIISSMSDGNIDIPKRSDIIYHGALPYKKSQELFDECHLYVMPSIRESYGITYIEAMAKGLLVVARDYEPQREIVDYGNCGFLTKLDSDALCSILEEIDSMDMEHQLSILQRAHKRYLEKYDYEVVKENWHQAILDCYSQK